MLRIQVSGTVYKRLLHTSRPVNGFMDWFSLKKSEEKKKNQQPIEKPKDINEVIKNAEEGKVELKRLEDVEFIGVKYRKGQAKNQFKLKTEEDINNKIKELNYDNWLNDKKISTLKELESVVIESYNEATNSKLSSINFEEINLDDLDLRFNLTLKIQEKSGFIIPDKILSEVTNLKELIKIIDFKILGNKTYLQKILEHKTLDINDLEFKSPNISIQAPVNSKQRKQTYNELLATAKKAQDYKAKKLIDESRV